MALKIKVTIPALDDLENIETYIKEEFANPTAAKRAVKKIMKSYSILKTSPYAGFSVRGKYGLDTSSRILVSGQYIIFYEVNENKNLIEILNVFHGKQNYITRLFPDYEEIDETEENYV